MRAKQILGALLCIFMTMTSCSQSKKAEAPQNHKILVAYFSATGTTRQAANDLAEAMGATVHEIVPEQPYTDADLDWRDSTSRSSTEMHNRSFRPAIADTLENIDDYDIVFIGYPNWWNTAPTIINTFIESHNMEGKTIVPFMTSGGGGIENSENDLHTAYPALNWGKGKLLNSYTAESLDSWKQELGL